MSQNVPVEQFPVLKRRAFLASLAGTSLCTIGCGADIYETRLKATKEYFEYLEKVNLALTAKWSPMDGIEIRVPKPFEPLAFPVTPAEGQPDEPPPAPADDPYRLGYHPNVHLEGVIATWKANVRVDGGEALAYLHLLGNLARFEEKLTNVDIDPLRYLSDLTNQLAAAYNVVTDTTDAPWQWDMMRSFSPYVGKKKIESIAIPPEEQPINAIFYRMEVKDVQIVLLLIFPRNIDPSVHLEDRMKYTLEWLKVPAQAPQKKSNKPAGPSLF